MTRPQRIQIRRAKGRPVDAWLSHDADPEQFGDAIMLCLGYAPECSTRGACANDGECFRTEGMAREMARRIIERAARDEERGDVRAALLEAAHWLRKQGRLALANPSDGAE